MCGPSGQQTAIAGSEQSLMQQLQQNYQTNFSEQQGVLNHLNDVLSPVIGAGPNQTGMSPAEVAAENTQAVDTTGAGAAAAERAAANESAGRNDSGNLPEAGVEQGIKAGIGSAAEGQLASEELGITKENYALGRANFENAEQGELAISGQENPNATAGAATSAGGAAFSAATEVQQEKNQEEADIAGGVESLATGGLSGFANLDMTGSSTPGEQVMNFAEGF